MVMPKVNVFEIKAKLSEYLDRATRGERIVISRHEAQEELDMWDGVAASDPSGTRRRSRPVS